MTADLALLIGIIVLLIVASAFFSSAETALTAASDARMRQLASKGNRRARLVERLRDDREGLIGSILIGNNAVNVIASALATSLFISLFDEAGVLWATIVMTVVLVVFCRGHAENLCADLFRQICARHCAARSRCCPDTQPAVDRTADAGEPADRQARDR